MLSRATTPACSSDDGGTSEKIHEGPVEQFTRSSVSCWPEPPHGESKIIAAARSIAEALKALPIDDPRAIRISRALGAVAELDPDSEKELNEAIIGFALELKNLFQ